MLERRAQGTDAMDKCLQCWERQRELGAEIRVKFRIDFGSKGTESHMGARISLPDSFDPNSRPGALQPLLYADALSG